MKNGKSSNHHFGITGKKFEPVRIPYFVFFEKIKNNLPVDAGVVNISKLPKSILVMIETQKSFKFYH